MPSHIKTFQKIEELQLKYFKQSKFSNCMAHNGQGLALLGDLKNVCPATKAQLKN